MKKLLEQLTNQRVNFSIEYEFKAKSFTGHLDHQPREGFQTSAEDRYEDIEAEDVHDLQVQIKQFLEEIRVD